MSMVRLEPMVTGYSYVKDRLSMRAYSYVKSSARDRLSSYVKPYRPRTQGSPHEAGFPVSLVDEAAS